MRTYLVTGTAAGIGRATRQVLEARGDRVIGVDLREGDITLDLFDPEQRSRLPEGLERLGVDHIDGVAPCAGVSSFGSTPEQVVRINYYGSLAAVELLRPYLLRSAAPRVCMVCSTGLLRCPDDESLYDALDAGEEVAVPAFAHLTSQDAYAVTKRALGRWVRRNAVSDAWLASRTLINAVAPGLIMTQMVAPLVNNPAVPMMPAPMGIGEPEDVGRPIAFLMGPENTFITGQILFVDGGREAVACGPDPSQRYPDPG